MNAPIAASPAAPLDATNLIDGRSMPPIASTGVPPAAATTAARPSHPSNLPSGLDLVGRTVPAMRYSASRRSAAAAALWIEHPIRNSLGTSGRASAGRKERSFRWTPAAPAASATSTRSLTRIRAGVPAEAAMSRSTSATSAAASRSGSRTCTRSTPAAAAALTCRSKRVCPIRRPGADGSAKAAAVGHQADGHACPSPGVREPKRSPSSARAAQTLTSPRPVTAPRK